MDEVEAAARRRARQTAHEHIGRGDPVGWFEELYRGAQWDGRQIPWGDMVINPHFREWTTQRRIDGTGRRSLVVGCGLGDDAEHIARLGFDVVAFDVSPTAIEWCRRRFPDSPVTYLVADLFASPRGWKGAFDLVLECHTLQVLPPDPRRRAMECIPRYVAPGGTLLAIARGRDLDDDPGRMPWPLTRDELDSFRRFGLQEVSFEDFMDEEDPPVRRFRAEYRAS